MTRLLPPHVLQSVLEQLAESVLITDATGRIVYVNGAFERLTGYGREEVLGKNPRFLKSGHHPLEFYRRFWEEILSGHPFRGVFVNRRKDGTLYTEEKVVTPIRGPSGAVEYLVATSRDVTEEMALRARLEALSTLDPLTGLLNRRAFAERVKKDILYARSRRALAYLDLDGFKTVNDTLGHAAGDEVLAQLARNLKGALPQAVVGRLGGDEFAAWYPADDLGEAKAKAALLLRAASVEVSVHGQPVRLEASLGLVLFPDHGVSLQELLRRADLAMYRAKLFRLKEPEAFTPDLDGLTPQALALEAEFHHALTTGQSQLFLQGILNLKEDRLEDAEVLFRLRRPEGYVNPLPQMDLSRRALNEVLDRFVLQELQRLQSTHPGLTVWVNVTPWSLGDTSFLNLAERLIHQGLDPGRAVIEVSERTATHQLGRIAPALWRLKGLGFRLALDDFGTGATGLGHLRQLPLDLLKVGRELLSPPGPGGSPSRALLGHLVGMAHDLGLKVVLEGVETPEQLALARELRADFAQGFHIHRPEAHPLLPRRWLEKGESQVGDGSKED
ncbi:MULTISPECIES: putative bifunctional diguanylate cyclase/phosphodiesterase [Thermus]|jgi:diguanylate cyclase (GGDEF)-like protein/PAS domain S-box-containing protein|uniref:GGDEF domain-containing protein n=1 Tax=Thermus brockianus TaxID=56956 RepID=A0A1J0LXV6_THEBO|nr:EAL domain-containing protein [Thermus brockianus]APD10435.1 GGDEF domain-containing protein [Thermus brockianus]